MKGSVINGNYACPDGQTRKARRIYIEAWMRWGFSIILLHKRSMHGECCCSKFSHSRKKNRSEYEAAIAEGRMPSCSNPGKHMIDKGPRAVAGSIEEIEAHLDDGGSIGLSLRIKGVPDPPARLVVFDCDKDGAEGWLHARTQESPLASRGRSVGMHDYQVITAGVPNLRSDTASLNPGRKNPATDQKPGIDVKVSGLVVMAFSQNKTLFWNGRDISQDPAAVAKVFGGTLDDFLAFLPQIDPRSIAPQMRELIIPIVVGATPGNVGGGAVSKRKRSSAGHTPLSTSRPPKETVQGKLHNVAYHHRKHLADGFLVKTMPAIEGQNPDGTIFRVVAALLKHYFLSEADAYSLIQKRFNPRCLDAKGKPYPYGVRQLVKMIQDATAAAFDPIGLQDEPDYVHDAEAMRANHRRRDQRSNEKRKQRRASTRAVEAELIYQFISTCCLRTPDRTVRVLQCDLYDACVAWIWGKYGVKISRMKIGGVLDHYGFTSERVGHAKKIYRLGIRIFKQLAA